MFALFDYVVALIANKVVLLGAISFSFFIKFFILFYLGKHLLKSSSLRTPALLLSIFLTGAMFEDICYMLRLLIYHIGIIEFTGEVASLTCLIRISSVVSIQLYQALALFFDYIIERKGRWTLFHWPHLLFNIGLSSCFLYLAFFKYGVPSDRPETLYFEIKLMQIFYIYLTFLFASLFFKIYRKTRRKELPKILAYQVLYLRNFVIPYILLFIASNEHSYLGALLPFFWIRIHSFYTVSTIICTYAMLFIGRRITDLRFLNMREDVESREKFNFLSQFKDILEQLSYASALKELAHLTQTFFQTAFGISLGRTRLYIRKTEAEKDDYGYYDIANTAAKVENFIGKNEHENEIITPLRTSKIFIRDEIHFSNFYADDPSSKAILQFMDLINADIFLPIYERNAISAYIIVERDARPHRLFTNKERDEMLVFTTYLSNIINILKYSNIEALHQRHKYLSEELYLKHQEINQYKESIRSFVRANKERKIGIVFYKHRRFTLANEAAHELIGIDLNTNEGHTLTQAFKSVARRVLEYKTSQTSFSRDSNGQKIIIAGIPSTDENSTILLVYYPEISDIVKSQLDQLKDPSTWDYILYLETTKSGQVINQLIPGTGEKLINFKINLLATALSKKATLLDMPEEDLIHTVEILHDISLRQTLHTIKLASPEKNDEVAMKLFGLNPLMQKDAPPALLEKLDGIGTLFIQNVEYLGKETQEYLAEFITFGFFHKFKSDHKVFSNVRIICSSNKDLLTLVNEGKFCKALYDELHQASLVMPSLHELSEAEVHTLAQGYAEQIVTTQTYKNLLALTEKDKSKLSTERPLSLHEFKEKVHQMLVTKSTKHKISEITEFDPAYNVSDPDIAQAVRLGKKALKDAHIMTMLWNKFRNQNKIATLLGVNRSSVNRRCQEYNLK